MLPRSTSYLAVSVLVLITLLLSAILARALTSPSPTLGAEPRKPASAVTDADPTPTTPADGAYQWHTFYGSNAADHGCGIATDGAGSLVVIGHSEASWNGPAGQAPLHPHSGSTDAYVLKLAPDGAYQWHTFYGGPGRDECGRIAIDSSGSVVVTGQSYAGWNGPTGQAPLHAHSGNMDGYVLRLSPEGAYQWHTFYGSNNVDWGWDIAIDSSGSVVVTGQSYTGWNGPTGQPPRHAHSGSADAYVLMLSPEGAYRWHTFYGGPADDYGCGVAVDNSNSVVITGFSWAPSWTGPTGQAPLHPHSGNTDTYVLKLSSDGAYQWHTFYGSSDEDVGFGIAVDAGGDLVVTAQSFAAWNGPAAQSPLHAYGGGADALVVKLSPDGAYHWHTFYGGSSDDWSLGIAVGSGGSVVITGFSPESSWTGPAGWPPLHPYSGGTDAFVLELSSGGAYQWHTFYGSPVVDEGGAIAVDSTGSLVVTGQSYGSWVGPLGQPPLHSYGGTTDAFVLRLGVVLISPTSLDFGESLTSLTLTIDTEGPSDAWSLSESLPWLTLSSSAGLGPATITATVDRGALASGTHTGTINASVGGEAIPVQVSMEVTTPDVALITPASGATVYYGGSLPVRTAVTLDGGPVTDAVVTGSLALDQVFSIPIALFDDGAHDDGAAADGVYAGRIMLYGPQVMPATGNPYTLTLSATSDGQTRTTTAPLNVVRSDGAPAVQLAVSGPGAPDTFAGETVTLTAHLTYPDGALRTATGVTVTVSAPDSSTARVRLANTGTDTWQGIYPIPAGTFGTLDFDAHALPPAGSGFVDGWQGTSIEVYRDTLALSVVEGPGTYNRHMPVPLGVCVTAGATGVARAEVIAAIDPDGDTVLLSHVGAGCYAADYLPDGEGARTVTYTARALGYKENATSSTFTVLASDPAIADSVTAFAGDAVGWSNRTLALSARIAATGDWFAGRLTADQAHRAIRFSMDVIDILATSAHAQAGRDVLRAGLPGASQWSVDSTSLIEALFAPPLVSGVTGASAAALDDLFTDYVEAPYRFYALQADTGVQPDRPLRDLVEDTYPALLLQPDALTHSVQGPLQTAVHQVQLGVQSRAAEIGADPPSLSSGAQAAYALDLARRQLGSQWLAHADLDDRSAMLFDLQDRRIAMQDDAVRRARTYLSEAGLEVGLGRLLNDFHLGWTAGDAAPAAYHAYLNASAVEQDQPFRDLAIGLMSQAHRAQGIITANTLAGLDGVASGVLPGTPNGRIVLVDLVRTTLAPPLAYITQDVYADLRVENTGDVTAAYAVIGTYAVTGTYAVLGTYTAERASGTWDQVLTEMRDPATGAVTSWVTLGPGESTGIRLYLVKKNEHDFGLPKWGLTFALVALTDEGVYGLSRPTYAFEPQPVVATAAAASTTAHSLADMVAATDRYPIWANVAAAPDQLTHTLGIAASNPFPMPLPVVISQTIPAAVTIVSANEGVVRDGVMLWYREIPPRDTILLDYVFEVEGSYETATSLPPVALGFYDAAGDLTVDLDTGPISFTTGLPLRVGAAVLSSVPFGTPQTITVTAQNLDRNSPHGAGIGLQILSLDGTPLMEKSAPLSLASDATLTHLVTYTPPDPGLYLLTLDLTYGGRTRPIIRTLLEVTGSPQNHAPHIPGNPTPAAAATEVAVTTGLSWTGGDPDGDTVTYDVSFAANDSTPAVVVCSDVATPACDPGPLSYNTHYYWQVVATDASGAATTGPVWDFTTQAQPSGAFSKTKPTNGATDQPATVTLSWEAGGGAIGYEHCVDRIDNDACDTGWTSVGDAISVTLSNLSPGTTYYWQVRARHVAGTTEADAGDWWAFTTAHSLDHTLYLPVVLNAHSTIDTQSSQPTPRVRRPT